MREIERTEAVTFLSNIKMRMRKQEEQVIIALIAIV